GVWWSSMSYKQRINYLPYLENQDEIEEGWDVTFGDRKNEIVFIGQDMDETSIRKQLDDCLSTEEELATSFWVEGYDDGWPVPRFTDMN
ncbi:MAG: GTP-binding protein, partial [Bacteroidota bacterium]